MSDYSVPTALGHKPIFAVKDYDAKDGYYTGNTDAQHLSLGISQWSPEDISLKVWRHTENRWSRQSEELPPHRVLDLAILFCAVLLNQEERAVQTDVGNYQIKVDLIPEGKQELEKLKCFFKNNKETFLPRMRILNTLLNEMEQSKSA